MRRTGYLGISLLLVFVLAASALPGFGQAAPAAQAKGPQAKTQAEYTAYVTFFNEKDPVKKAPLGEKFITDFSVEKADSAGVSRVFGRDDALGTECGELTVR